MSGICSAHQGYQRGCAICDALGSLFQRGLFPLHSGGISNFKIECDALTDQDLDTLARLTAERVWYEDVIGVPTGGYRFAEALRRYTRPLGCFLIADDVLTTGASMEQAKAELTRDDTEMPVRGVVIFSRSFHVPTWIMPIFQMWGG